MTILYLFLDINNKNAYTAKISLFFRLVGVWTQEIYENSSKMNRNQQRFGKIYHFQSFYHLSDSENQSLIPNFCYINLISRSLSPSLWGNLAIFCLSDFTWNQFIKSVESQNQLFWQFQHLFRFFVNFCILSELKLIKNQIVS